MCCLFSGRKGVVLDVVAITEEEGRRKRFCRAKIGRSMSFAGETDCIAFQVRNDDRYALSGTLCFIRVRRGTVWMATTKSAVLTPVGNMNRRRGSCQIQMMVFSCPQLLPYIVRIDPIVCANFRRLGTIVDVLSTSELCFLKLQEFSSSFSFT